MTTQSGIRRRNVALTAVALCITLLVASNAASQTPTDYFPASEWRTAKPQKQGLNKKILKSLTNRLRTNQIRDLNSLLIVRNGYLWWLLPVDGTGVSQGDDVDVYTAAGARDQWIFAIPKYDMVVVVTGNTSATFAQPVDFLYSDILRAVE